MPDTNPASELSESATIRLEVVATIVAAFAQSGNVTIDNVGALITNIGTAVDGLITPATVEVVAEAVKEPAVSIKKSITPDYLVCLEDGQKLKSLKRYLRTHYDLTPEAYRAKWGLDKSYPMVAPNYSKARSELARSMGLGRKAGETKEVRAAAKAAPAAKAKAAPKAKKAAAPAPVAETAAA